VHEVALSPFLIGKYEVTRAEWAELRKGSLSSPDFRQGLLPGKTNEENRRPQENLSWEDIHKTEAKTGLRLPTEAQWEYACRGGSPKPFEGTGNLDDMGWFAGNSGAISHPVGKKGPNDFGLHDMHGNMWEWCEDLYDGSFYGKPNAREPDPVSAAGSIYRVIRGGGWFVAARACRSSVRAWEEPSERANVVLGFRLAYRLP
jgi:formylglycine-generating enzyme required for sulfatase activity